MYKVIFLTLLFVFSCSDKNVTIKKTFVIKRDFKDEIDTIQVEFTEGRKQENYRLALNRSKGNTKEILLNRKSEAAIYMKPRGSYLKRFEMFPDPTPFEKWEIGQELFGEIEIPGKVTRKYKTHQKVIGKTQYNVSVLKSDSWIIEVSSSFKDKVNTAKYFYNKDYGFVYFHYEIKQKIYDIDLIEIN